jgi:hypothetical protein
LGVAASRWAALLPAVALRHPLSLSPIGLGQVTVSLGAPLFFTSFNSAQPSLSNSFMTHSSVTFLSVDALCFLPRQEK